MVLIYGWLRCSLEALYPFSRPVNQTQAQQQERSDQNPPTATSQGRRKETTSHTQRIKRRGLEQKSKKGARGRCAGADVRGADEH